MEPWTDGITFETISPVRQVLKATLINPLANYLPAVLVKGVLRITKSELAAANWKDPGGWRSMVISYEGNPKQIADKVLVNAGTMSMALRNRRKLGANVLRTLMEQSQADPVHVLCLGAGPGRIITDAMSACKKNVFATLIDLSSDAFDYGRQIANKAGLTDRVRFIQGDVRDVKHMLQGPSHLVKMLGICEYLSDGYVKSITAEVAAVMPKGAAIVFNSLSPAHGTDRFFRRIFGLNMIHRSAQQLQDLMGSAGFGEFKKVSEPLGVYDIVIGRKL